MIIIIIISFLFAGLAEGIMDWLQFRLPLQIKHKWVYHQFWDPRISWKNKWNVRYSYLGKQMIGDKERFFLSSTVLVFLTDGWHLMKWFRNRAMDVAFTGIICKSTDISFWYILLFILVLRLFYGLGFYLTFKKLL
jgi:hypothetical protein